MGLQEMKNCADLPKKIVLNMITAAYDVQSKELEKALHISRGVVSRHMTGIHNYPEIDIYIIEKMFGIKVKDYKVNE